jgi:hypothetical protein
LAIVAATALPQVWPPRISAGGDLVLELGRGGLREWRAILDSPTSWTSVLLLANVLVYVPFGFLGVMAWPHRKGLVFAAGVGISLLVEFSHFTISERVASTDDVLLNVLGLSLGWVLGVCASALLGRWTGEEREPTDADRNQAISPVQILASCRKRPDQNLKMPICSASMTRIPSGPRT